MAFIPVLREQDLWVGEMRGLVIAGCRVLLVRLEQGICAYEDRCAHLGLPLSQGTLEGWVLTCAAHHFQYDARTGEGINPRSARLVGLPTQLVDGEVLVDVPDAGRTGPGAKSEGARHG